MPTLKERIEFAKRHVRNKEGRRFHTDIAWQIDHLWKAVDGYKLAATDPECLCRKCRTRIGTLVPEWSWKLAGELRRHAGQRVSIDSADLSDTEVAHRKGRGEMSCRGLRLEPVIVTFINVPRRGGKTFGIAAWILTLICLCHRRFVLFLASAGEQADRLFEDNWRAIIDQDEDLVEHTRIVGDQLMVPSTGSFMRVVPSNFRTIAGGGYSHILIDEAKDVHPRVVAAAALSCRDQGGAECPHGHEMKPQIPQEEAGKHRCKHCRAKMVPWYPRLIVISSSSIIDDSPFDWFEEVKEHLEKEGDMNAHLYATEEQQNPAVSSKVTGALGRILGASEKMRDYIEAELSNRARRLGESFITDRELQHLFNPRIRSTDFDERPAVAFLDTSWSQDITSLVIAVDAGWGEDGHVPWERLRIVHIAKWKPAEMPKRRIDEDTIQSHLERVIPGFPRLRRLLVDDRGMAWAKDMVVRLNKYNTGGWGRRVFLFHGKGRKDGPMRKRGQRIDGIFGGKEDRSLAWQMFEYRIMSRMVEGPDDPDAKKELRGVHRKRLPDGSYLILDRNRKVTHVDVAEGMAGVCLLAYLEQQEGRTGLEDIYSDQGRHQELARVFRPLTSGLTDDQRRKF